MQIKFSQIAALLILLFKKFHNSYTFNTLFASKMQPETSVLENDFFLPNMLVSVEVSSVFALEGFDYK